MTHSEIENSGMEGSESPRVPVNSPINRHLDAAATTEHENNEKESLIEAFGGWFQRVCVVRSFRSKLFYSQHLFVALQQPGDLW